MPVPPILALWHGWVPAFAGMTGVWGYGGYLRTGVAGAAEGQHGLEGGGVEAGRDGRAGAMVRQDAGGEIVQQRLQGEELVPFTNAARFSSNGGMS